MNTLISVGKVRRVGIIAVNMVKRVVKNKHPALLMILLASLPIPKNTSLEKKIRCMRE